MNLSRKSRNFLAIGLVVLLFEIGLGQVAWVPWTILAELVIAYI